MKIDPELATRKRQFSQQEVVEIARLAKERKISLQEASRVWAIDKGILSPSQGDA